MAASYTNLFAFNRSLPNPYDSLPSKKVSVTSKYGSGTEATLSAAVIKGIHAVCRCRQGTAEGAVGTIDHKNVCEYKSSNPEEFHIIVHDSATGNLMGSVFRKDDETFATYTANSANRDAAAIMMAMYPTFMSDSEFEDTFVDYYDEFIKGLPDLTKASQLMGVLCDNVYRRIKDDTCPAHINVTIDNAGNLMRVSQVHLDSGAFTPKSVTAGEFTIFAKTGPATIHRLSTIIPHTDFVGKYVMQKRTLSPAEQALVPVLPAWYIIPEEVVDICKHAQHTTGKAAQMRNFMLRGPAGTGKTMGARAIAAGLGLPYMKYTCNASTEIFDFVGQIFPDSEGGSTGNAQLDAEKKQLDAMGGMTYPNVAKLMNMPDLADMDYDPAGVYKALTGIEKADACTQDCMAIVMERVMEKVKALSKRAENAGSQGQSFTYVETDFLKALKHGYVVEIQEPTVIMQPGVLVGLNSLLEQEGSITLPTGEVIQRHPDTVVVVTTNVTYEGCRGLNQSVIDRMSLVRDVELPSNEIMAERAMSVTGATDEVMVSQMVQVVTDMADFCRKNGISDGSVGMRGLINWIQSTEITGDVYQSALYTIVSGASANDDDRNSLIASVLEPIFAPKRASATT